MTYYFILFTVWYIAFYAASIAERIADFDSAAVAIFRAAIFASLVTFFFHEVW